MILLSRNKKTGTRGRARNKKKKVYHGQYIQGKKHGEDLLPGPDGRLYPCHNSFGLDRVVSMFAEIDSIRDTIAFPKNNSGRDVMVDAPCPIDQAQLDELQLALNLKD